MLNLSRFKFPKLKEEDCGRSGIKKKYWAQQCRIAVKNLLKNGFEATFCETVGDAAEQILKLIPDGGVVGCGDSHTVFALDLDDRLERKKCTAIPHSCAVNKFAFDQQTPGFTILGNREETREILRNYLVADVFLLGANAITIDGQIINIDGTGNRIAGSLYGSDRVIVVAGANKIVKDVQSGLERIRFIAAQMNNIKYGNNLSCNKCGVCRECRSESRYCNITNIIHRRPDQSDFHVVLIGEDLGF